MKSNWSDDEAQATIDRYVDRPDVNEDIALRVYTSRLIGRDPSLVLHGGGNTSVKTALTDDTGAEVQVLCVKGSGWGLGDIEPEGLPAVRLESLGTLRNRETLSDEDMVNAQRIRLLDAGSPNPSVETLLHAFLPFKFIDHSHADAILALVDQPNAEEVCREVFGDTLAIVPYIMPGFALAKLAAEIQEKHPKAEGLLLLRHGLFTYGDSAKESYERHIAAVDKAERYAKDRAAKQSVKRKTIDASPAYETLAPVLRGRLGAEGRRYILTLRTSDAIEAFLSRQDLAEVSQRGTATPDHVIRTKRVPLLLDVKAGSSHEQMVEHIDERLAAYRTAYASYVEREAGGKGRKVKALDPDPRIVLVPGLGLIAAGSTEKAASIAADIYEHTVDVIQAAEAVGRYEVLGTADLFDMEYWSLEQAKLGKAAPKVLQGQVVYVSGAARGIGAACARRFAAEGASLYLTDRDEAVQAIAEALGARCEVVDVRDEKSVSGSVEHCVAAFGGIDGVISNAGAAPQAAIDQVSTADLKESFEINFFSHQYLASAAARVMRAQGTGGSLLFNASKAAFNPGANFGPYAIPKAAVVALMKQYALEGGDAGIRSNAVNADRVRTQLLDPVTVEKRARARGLDADAYFRSNLLAREVTAEDVADAFLSLALAKSTTGCVVTVDGGNIAASPR